MLEYIRRLTPAGSSYAHRLFFVCHTQGHLTFLGYDKQVDFNQEEHNLRPIQFEAHKTFEEEEAEDEYEWNQMKMNALLRRRVFH